MKKYMSKFATAMLVSLFAFLLVQGFPVKAEAAVAGPGNVSLKADGYYSLTLSWDEIEDTDRNLVTIYREDGTKYSEQELYGSQYIFNVGDAGTYYAEVSSYVWTDHGYVWTDASRSNKATVKTLAAPKSLTASAYYNDRYDYGIQVSWDKVTGADGYSVIAVKSANYKDLNNYRVYNSWEVEGTSMTIPYYYLEDGSWIILVKAYVEKYENWYDYTLFFGKAAKSTKVSIKAYDIYLSSAKQTALSKVKLSWEPLYDANIYYIYRKVKGGSYSLVKTIKDSSVTSWTDTNRTVGKTYYYKIRYEGWYGKSGYSNVISVPISLKAPSVTVTSANISSIKISWGSFAKGVDGYEIYRASSSAGSYSRVKTVTDSSKSSWTDTKKKLGVKWYYKVRAFTKDSSGKKTYGSFCSSKSGKANLAMTTIKSVKAKNGNSVELTWTKVASASGYEIYYSTKKSGTYSKGASVSSGSTLTATVKKLTNGKNYYFKVRAKKSLNGKVYRSDFTSPVVKCINTYAYDGESYEAKLKRVFGKTSYVRYSSDAEAKKHMTRVTVKCWDINSLGHKYTHYLSFDIHKNMAGTAKKMFEEIYNGKEKFPIHSIIGYGWRGNGSSSEHNQGLAIDINPDENYFYDFVNKKILAGTCFKPGKNPYSIPEYGEVEKIMVKYGFPRGRWSTKTDYMHFSYFGV